MTCQLRPIGRQFDAERRAVLARQQKDIAPIVGELDTLKAQCSQLLRRKERAAAGA